MPLDGPGWPGIQLADFADALGQIGLDQTARLVTERRAAAEPDSWAAVGIKILRQQLAALSGDIDAHVAVLAENLRTLRQDYSRLWETAERAGRVVRAPGLGAGVPARPGTGQGFLRAGS